MTSLPKQGKSWRELDGEMDAARKGDVDWRRGRDGGYIHYGGEEVLDVATQAYLNFFPGDGLTTKALRSLARFDRNVVGMRLRLLNGGADARGAMTTGGTES